MAVSFIIQHFDKMAVSFIIQHLSFIIFNYSLLAKYLSASNAAIQPDAAAVIA